MRCSSRAPRYGTGPHFWTSVWSVDWPPPLLCEPFWVNMALSLFVSVVDNSSNWAVCGTSSGVISMPVTAQAMHRVHMEVMPLFAGYLPLPDVRLFKYLPHHSAQSSQLDAGRDPGNDAARPRRRVCGSSVLFSSPTLGTRVL